MTQHIRRAGLAALVLGLAACTGEQAAHDATAPSTAGARAGEEAGIRLQYGPATRLGEGQVRTYIAYNLQNEPVEIGVAMSEAAMDGLPAPAPHGGHTHAAGNVVDLELPASNPTPFTYVELDWNPAGHEPAGIYDAPHFDFHFWTADKSVRASVDPADPAFQEKANRFPDARFLPEVYFTPLPAQAVPFMGVHWLDKNAPELPPQSKPFTTTYIFGTWDGALVFQEPMITRDYIMSKPNVVIPIPQPERVPASGYYPRAYRITYNAAAKEYRVALTRLWWRNVI